MSILNETSPERAPLARQPADMAAQTESVSSLLSAEPTRAHRKTFLAPTLIAIGMQIAGIIMLAVILWLFVSLRPGDGGLGGGGSGNGVSGQDGSGEHAAVGPGSGVSDKTSDAGSSDTSQEITEVTESSDRKQPKQNVGKTSSAPVVVQKPPRNQSGDFVVQELAKAAPAEQPAEQPAEPPGAGGGDGFSDLGDRLREAGAKSGDVQISLAWNNGNDLDLHVETPGGEKIWYNNRNSSCGGELDVDMNAGGPASQKPVENVFWPVGHSPNGKFRVFVDNYANQGGPDPTKYQVTIKVKGTSKSFTGTLRHGDPPKLVKEFTFP
ncbi:MAG: hypothetical protein JNM43_06150 [Planctomycetaceae bacterium]|nr:hypothetical protein [Planctomycetaceae bacterium]